MTLPPPLEGGNVIGAVSAVTPERSHGDEVPGGFQAAKLTERDPQLPGRLGWPEQGQFVHVASSLTVPA